MVDAIETVYENARAHSDVVQTATFELGYIVDRYHNGHLAIAIDDLADWSAENGSRLQRDRTADAISIRIDSAFEADDA